MIDKNAAWAKEIAIGKAEAPPCGCCPPRSPTVRATAKIGRNEPCPCGSGRKYKKCCARAVSQRDCAR